MKDNYTQIMIMNANECLSYSFKKHELISLYVLTYGSGIWKTLTVSLLTILCILKYNLSN